MPDTQFQADELFFSRVEARYSPQNRAGYQVVYHTSGISAGDVEAIEARVQCFSSGDIDDRMQFFSTPEGRYVIAVSRGLAEIDREITDRNGRSGAFVTHAYVLTPEAFARINNDPFVLLDQDPDRVQVNAREEVFELTAQGMIAIQQQNAGPVSIRANTHPRQPDVTDDTFPGWDDERFLTFVDLAGKAADYVEQGYSVALRSDHSGQLALMLSVLFYALQADQRPTCSFDTFVDGCLSRPGEIWLLGGEAPIRNARMTRIDLDTAEIDNLIELEVAGDEDPKARAFTRWLSAALRNSSLSAALGMIPEVHAIDAAFRQGRPFTGADTPQARQAAQDYIAANRETINQSVQRAIGEHIKDAATVQTITTALERGGSTRYVNMAASGRLSAGELSDIVFQWISRQRVEVNWKALQQFAANAGHTPLLAAAGIVASGKNGPDKPARDALASLARQPEQLARVLDAAVVQQGAALAPLVTADTAEGINRYLRDTGILGSMDAEQQLTLLRALSKHLDEGFFNGYTDRLGEDVLARMSKGGGRSNLLIVGGLGGLGVVGAVLIVLVLSNNGGGTAGGAEGTPEASPELTPEVTPETTGEASASRGSSITLTLDGIPMYTVT